MDIYSPAAPTQQGIYVVEYILLLSKDKSLVKTGHRKLICGLYMYNICILKNIHLKSCFYIISIIIYYIIIYYYFIVRWTETGDR